MFYLKCLDTKNGIKYNDWNHFSKTESFKKWSQYAFENICINQMSLIRNELSIGTEGFEDSSLYQNESSNENGENIDLVLVKGGYIYLLEIICFNSPYHSTELYTNSLIRKKQAFQTATQTKKTICLARISVDETPKHSWMHFENQLDLDNLVTD